MISLLFFSAGIFFMVYSRRGLVRFTGELMEYLDAVLAGQEQIDFRENEETLTGKLAVKIRRIAETLSMRAKENGRQKAELEAVISDISHQVRTPVAGIRMYHSLLEREGLSEEKRSEFLQAAERQVDRLEFFMDSMIRMSRLENGIVSVQPKRNPVRGLMEQAVCDIAARAMEKQIDIAVSCEEGLKAKFDSRWTLEALVNLLDNSVKYTKAGGTIRLDALRTDFYVRIRVKDNGRGIAQERIPKVYGRFYREPESAETEGLGIGLYLARNIVMKQDGFMDIHSAVGEGTEVSMHLPL